MPIRHLSPREATRTCRPSSLSFRSTQELEPLTGFLGQERAQAAIRYAVSMGLRGYNVYAVGTDGLGKVASHNFATDMPERRPRLAADGTPAGAHLRSVWTISTSPFPDTHFATFPTRLVEPLVKAGCPVGGLVVVDNSEREELAPALRSFDAKRYVALPYRQPGHPHWQTTLYRRVA